MDQKLVDAVIDEMKKDFSYGDETAIEEMLLLLLKNEDNRIILQCYLSEIPMF